MSAHSPSCGPAARPRRSRSPPGGHWRRRAAGNSAGRVAAYRGGYLPEDRRAVEQALRTGTVSGLATTNALELGVDICGLDAVILAGWPGTRASLWQQAGRAGRSGGAAVAVLVARDDPLDTYLVHHPDAVFGNPVEATVIDPDNPMCLPRICALPPPNCRLPMPISTFSARPRPTWWRAWPTASCCAAATRAGSGPDVTRTVTANIRGAGGLGVQLVEETTGRLLGTIDEPSAHTMAHTGAIYLHQGETFLVTALDLADRAALVRPGDPGYTTTARELTEIEVMAPAHSVTGARRRCTSARWM